MVDAVERQEIGCLGIGVRIDPGAGLVGGAARERLGHRTSPLHGGLAPATRSAGLVSATIVRRACHTGPPMTTDVERIAAARRAYADLAPRVMAGEPWAMAADYGTGPEASWGPREVLAHVEEMLPFWLGEMERVIDGDGSAPVPFGRTADDPIRIGLIERDRSLPLRVLFARIDAGLAPGRSASRPWARATARASVSTHGSARCRRRRSSNGSSSVTPRTTSPS